MPGRPHSERADEPVRVIIADNDPLARRMIRDALQAAGILVVAEAHDGREATELTLYYRPDVVLMDIVMPGMDGITATREILASSPDQLIVLLTSAEEEEEMGMLGLRAGAVGFLTKDVDVAALPRALIGALHGEAGVSRRFAMRLIETLRQSPAQSGLRPVRSPLTAREWEVVDLLCEGRTTDEIASLLVLSNETVRTHVKHILRKLGASSRAEAVAIAQQMRGGPPPPRFTRDA